MSIIFKICVQSCEVLIDTTNPKSCVQTCTTERPYIDKTELATCRDKCPDTAKYAQKIENKWECVN